MPQRETFIMEVVVADADGTQVGEMRTFDLYDHRGRTWMARHCWWAAHCGYSVHSRPAAVEGN